MANFELDYVLDKLIRTHFKEAVFTGDKYNLRCNVCGDSRSNKYTKSAYILLSSEPYVYYCHRGSCNVSISVTSWMKEYFPDFYQEYIANAFKKKAETDGLDNLKIKKVKRVIEKPLVPDIKKLLEDNKDVSCFEKIDDCGIEWCEKRKISSDIYKKWYVAYRGVFRDRIIIPFYDDKDNVYYFQARTLTDKIPKYKNPVSEVKPIYNIFRVDRKKPVIAFEGVIDSLFVENSIAIIGVDNNQKILNSFDLKYILDNDEAGRKKSSELLLNQKYVFMWKKFLKENKYFDVKDFNDIVIKYGKKKFSYEELENYFTNDIRLRGLL